MKSVATLALLVAAAALGLVSAQEFPQDKSFTYNNLPHQWRAGQVGYNDCATQKGSTDPSGNNMCQTAYVNSVQDFCLWGPPQAGSEVGSTEEEQVAYCTSASHNTRVFPAGTILGAHFVQTSQYIQITGVGDFTKINIKKGDSGGELDPYGATLQGNPVGGLVYSTAFGGSTPQQVHVWTNFMSDSQFCIRACMGDQAPMYCQHIYDVQGCDWNMPANYAGGVYEQCVGEPDEPMGVYGGSTWYQPQSGHVTTTPAAHPAAPSSQCQTFSTVGSGVILAASSSVMNLSTSLMTSSMSGSGSSSVISLSTSLPSSSMSLTTITTSSSLSAASVSPAQLVATSTSLTSTATPTTSTQTGAGTTGAIDRRALILALMTAAIVMISMR